MDILDHAATPFWDRVRRSAACWVWTGYRDKWAYGRVRFGGRVQGAHRVAWQLAYGAIPGGAYVLHHCDNPSCVRPSHLFLGDDRANAIDYGMIESTRDFHQRNAKQQTAILNQIAKLAGA